MPTRRLLALASAFALCAFQVRGQETGNVIFGGAGKHRNSGAITGNLSASEPKDSVAASFVEANVLLNVKADEFVAVFAVAKEGKTLTEINEKLAGQIKDFLAALAGLGARKEDIFVDFISQNRIYDYSVAGDTATEGLSGFEVKKNVSVRYKDEAMLEKILAAAARSAIFDLVKVDYVVGNMAGLREQLRVEAAKVIKKKEAEYARLFGIELRAAAVSQEKFNAFFPSEMYSSYTAFETGDAYRGNLRAVAKRKTSTPYFDPLDPAEFDIVMGPSPAEPVVQMTLFLKLRYSGPK